MSTFVRPGSIESQCSITEQDGRYANDFMKIKQIGKGEFGTVWEVNDKQTKKAFALKKIWLRSENDLQSFSKEASLLSECTGDKVVRFIDAWTEGNEFGYILMEKCDLNLKDVMAMKADSFGRKNSLSLNTLEFFVSTQLLKELAHCLDYLHSQNPPIMHRDMKPENVLVKDGRLKISDFGCAKPQIHSSNTQNKGSERYMAPEVREGRHYNLKADLYSLSVIALNLYGLEFEKSYKDLESWNRWFNSRTYMSFVQDKLTKYYKVLIEILGDCITANDYNLRPSCPQFIKMIDTWSIAKQSILDDHNFQNEHDNLLKSNNVFFVQYFNEKFI